MDTKPEEAEAGEQSPWRAFLADDNDEVITDPAEILEHLGDENARGSISIRRGSALPNEHGTFLGTYYSQDVFMEIDLNNVEPEDGAAVWELVQKAAWGMNQDVEDMAARA